MQNLTITLLLTICPCSLPEKHHGSYQVPSENSCIKVPTIATNQVSQMQKSPQTADFRANKKPPADKISFINRWCLIWRRRRDSNPRTALTAYALSRGTSYSHLSTSPYKVFCHPAAIYHRMGPLSVIQLCVSIFSRDERKWPRGWDSNPRGLAPKRFSRPPRYDRFDTSRLITQALL